MVGFNENYTVASSQGGRLAGRWIPPDGACRFFRLAKALDPRQSSDRTNRPLWCGIHRAHVCKHVFSQTRNAGLVCLPSAVMAGHG